MRAVDRRAKALPAEYRRSPKEVDRNFVGVPEGEIGPVEAKLREYGDLKTLVFGAFAETSDDGHTLIHQIAEARMRFQGLQRGREGQKEELGVLIGMVRRRLSVTAVRAQAELLLNRMQAAEGNPMEAKRRHFAQVQDVMMRKEREANWICKVSGERVIRRGRCKLD